MKQEDMEEEIDENSNKENMCIIINDTIKSKSDEVFFLKELENMTDDDTNIHKEINSLVTDSNKYIITLNKIKEKTGCCNETR